MSPFRSRAQERFMFAQHPEIAKRWLKQYGQPQHLPQHTRKRKAKRTRKPPPASQ